jgi:HK97 family phage major capsid protein
MSIELNQTPEQLLTELRTTFEAKTSGYEAKFEKISAELDKQEKISQAKTLELAEVKSLRLEQEAKLASLEADFKRGNFQGEEKKAKLEEVKAFEKFLAEGKNDVRFSAEAKYLRTDNNEQGGYLAPSEYVNEIIKNITEVSPVRSVARIIPTTKKEVQIPKRTGLISGGWVGEGAAAVASQSTFGMETLQAEKMVAFCDVSIEMLRDSAFDIQAQVSQDVAEEFARLEGLGFISGNPGAAQPEGLLTNASIASYNSGAAAALTADSLFAIQGELKAGYDLTWMFNRKTLHQNIRVLKTSGSGEYLLQMGLGSLPNTVAGLPYVLANDMPDVAAGTFPILLGDFRKGYYIVDNRNVEVLEDALTQAINGKRRYIFFKRTGGQVVLPEAIKKLKISA